MEFWLSAAFIDTGEYVDLAKAADRLGFTTVALSDHIFYADYDARYPYTKTGAPPYEPGTHWPDVWVTIGAMAAVTERVRLATNVYIAPARDLFTVGKAISTAAALSGDRVVAGLGVGWCKDEFLQTGQDFHTRGKRLDEMIPALRELWKGGMVEHHGTHYDYGPLRIMPVPAKPIPIFIGGDSDAALRRTARHGDGWVGNRFYSEEQLEELIVRLEGFLAEEGRTLDDVDVIAPLAVMPAADLYRKWEDRGVKGVMAAPWYTLSPEIKAANSGNPLGMKIAAMEDYAEQIIGKM